MSSNAEIYLKSDHTRVVGDLDVGNDDSTDPPAIRLRPFDASVTVGSDASGIGGRVRVRNTSGEDVALLETRDGAGYLEVGAASGDPVVRLDGGSTGDPERVEVAQSGTTVASVDHTSDGGQFTVHNVLNEEPAVEVGVRPAGGSGDQTGEVAVRDASGERTGELRGDDGTLLLSGTSGAARSTAGGGELVLGKTDGQNLDVHVHATGKPDSDYGVANDNRPKIYLNGPEATLELGRGRVNEAAKADNGEIVIRDDRGDSMLETRATETGSEVVFRWSNDGTEELRGAVRAHEEGLMVYDAGNRPAMLLRPSGVIETRKAVRENQGPLR